MDNFSLETIVERLFPRNMMRISHLAKDFQQK